LTLWRCSGGGWKMDRFTQFGLAATSGDWAGSLIIDESTVTGPAF
jgi:hypothetical protein